MKNAFQATNYLLSQNVFSAHPFTLIDVGCSGGISEYWRVFGQHLRAYAFDRMIHEIERLQATETNPNVNYYSRWIGLPDGHPIIKSRGSKDPWGNNPWESLSTAWAIKLLSSEDCNHEKIVKLNKWPETLLADKSTRIGISEFVATHHINSIDFIKIDVDGDDFHVLVSCADIINSCDVLGFMVEINYFGTACETDHTFHNIDRYMRKHGFGLFDLSIRRYSRRAMPAPFVLDMPAQTKWGVPLQGDALYIRNTGQPTDRNEPFQLSPDKLLKLVSIFEIFGLPDCAAEVITTHSSQLSEIINVSILLDLLTPEFKGKKVSYKEYIHLFSEDATRFYPLNIKQKDRWFKSIKSEPAASCGTNELTNTTEQSKAFPSFIQRIPIMGSLIWWAYMILKARQR